MGSALGWGLVLESEGVSRTLRKRTMSLRKQRFPDYKKGRWRKFHRASLRKEIIDLQGKLGNWHLTTGELLELQERIGLARKRLKVLGDDV